VLAESVPAPKTAQPLVPDSLSPLVNKFALWARTSDGWGCNRLRLNRAAKTINNKDGNERFLMEDSFIRKVEIF
jgi:hypothetical protein